MCSPRRGGFRSEGSHAVRRCGLVGTDPVAVELRGCSVSQSPSTAADHPALACHPHLAGWLADERAAGRLPADPTTRADVLHASLTVLAARPDPGTGLARLANQTLGRAHALDGGPVLGLRRGRPVVSVVGAILAAGRKFFAASRRPRVTFQVDHVDEVWEDGWSLLAFGWLRMVEDPGELARVWHPPAAAVGGRRQAALPRP